MAYRICGARECLVVHEEKEMRNRNTVADQVADVVPTSCTDLGFGYFDTDLNLMEKLKKKKKNACAEVLK